MSQHIIMSVDRCAASLFLNALSHVVHHLLLNSILLRPLLPL